jgi:cytochrome b6-f complex iron-sulfur subunit
VIEEKPNRRDFLHSVLGGSFLAWVASVIYPVIRYVIPPKEMEAEVTSEKVGLLSEIPPNSGKVVKFGTKPVIVLRKPNGDFSAFYAKCSHLDCIVQYRPDMQRIWCACHNGQYDLNGLNVAGPPPRPLSPLEVRVAGEEVYVTRKA